MAISSSTRKAGPFLGNDATTVFPFAFKVFTAADLRVVNTSALGIESDLELDVDYTVALNANQDNDPGGSITRLAALPTGERLTITSDVAALQPLVLTNQGGFYPRVINDAFDKITIIAQQLIEQVGRSLKLPISSTASATLPDPVPNGIIAWNSAANGFVNVPPGDLVAVAGYADARIETFVGDGVETDFEIDFHPGVLANLDISLGGVTQVGGVDFTWLGTTVVFASPPPSGVTGLIRYARPLSPVPNFDEVLSSVEDAQAAQAAAEAAAAQAAATLAGAAVKAQNLADLANIETAKRVLGFFQTRTEAVAAGTPLAPLTTVTLLGNTAVGDCAASNWKRVGSEPSHPGKMQLGTAWFELIEKIVAPEHFQAAGNGTANDGPAILNMLAYQATTGATIKGTPGAIYRITSDASFARTAASKPLLWDFNGSEILSDGGVLYLGASPTAFLTTTLSADVARGASYLPLTSVSGVAAGDMLIVESPALMHTGQAVRHTYIVTDLDGSNAYIQGTTVADITAQQVIDSGTSGSLVVKAYKLYAPVTLKNTRLRAIDPAGTGACLAINAPSDCSLEMVSEGQTRAHVVVQYYGTFRAASVKANHPGYLIKDQYASTGSHPSSLGYGYGISLNYGWLAQVYGGTGGRGWHLVDAAVGTMHTHIYAAYFGRNAYGVSNHEGSWHLYTHSCIFDGGMGVTAGRGVFYTSENDTFLNLVDHGISYTPACNVEIRIINPTFDMASAGSTAPSHIYRDGAGSAQPGAMSVGHERVFELLGGSIAGARRAVVGFRGAGRLTVKGTVLDRDAYLEVQCQAKTRLRDLDLGDLNVSGLDAAILLVISANHSIKVQNIVHENLTGSLPSLIWLLDAGGTAPVIDIADVTADCSYAMLTFQGSLPIRNVTNCRNVSGRLFDGAATNTVTNLSNCAYKTAVQVGGVVITTDHGNNKVLT